MDKVDPSLGSSKGGRGPRAPRADTLCVASILQTHVQCLYHRPSSPAQFCQGGLKDPSWRSGKDGTKPQGSGFDLMGVGEGTQRRAGPPSYRKERTTTAGIDPVPQPWRGHPGSHTGSCSPGPASLGDSWVSWTSAQVLCTCGTSGAHGKHGSVQPLPSGGQDHLQSLPTASRALSPARLSQRETSLEAELPDVCRRGLPEQQAVPIPPGGQVQKRPNCSHKIPASQPVKRETHVSTPRL